MDRGFEIRITFKFSDIIVRSHLSAGGPSMEIEKPPVILSFFIMFPYTNSLYHGLPWKLNSHPQTIQQNGNLG